MDDFEKQQPIAVILGICYDFCTLGELSNELGKSEDYKQFARKGKDYQNL
jgi:hypothetical protein